MFSSPNDYGEKVMGKIREFNELLEVCAIYCKIFATQIFFICAFFEGAQILYLCIILF